MCSSLFVAALLNGWVRLFPAATLVLSIYAGTKILTMRGRLNLMADELWEAQIAVGKMKSPEDNGVK